jgi:hypothetical protein
MRQAHEIERMSLVVRDLDERVVVVGLHDGANGSCRPPAGVGYELNDVEGVVSGTGHQKEVAGPQGMSTDVETRRGGRSPATNQIVATR